jgi:hypothetical protein
MVPHMSGTSIDAQKVSFTVKNILILRTYTDPDPSDTPTAPRLSSTSTSPAARITGLKIS